MRHLLYVLAVFVSMQGATQITVGPTDFATGGDTVIVSQSDTMDLDLVTTGADATWDFSGINITTQSIDTFYAVSDADFLYQAVFNNAFTYPDHQSEYYRPWFGGGLDAASQFGLGIEAPVQFTDVRSDSLVNTGIGFGINGVNIPGPSDTIDVQYYFPMQYGDSWTSPSFTEMDLNPTFDAIYKRYQTRNSVVDGWGEISTPFGTFQALRVKSQITAVDSFYIGLLSTWVELPTPDRVEYQWIANGKKVPVFEVITTDVGGTPTITSVRFKDKKRDFASVEQNQVEVNVYPNPADQQLQVKLTETAELVQVFDLTGKEIFTTVPTNSQLSIDVSDWKSGTYILRLMTSSGILSQPITVK